MLVEVNKHVKLIKEMENIILLEISLNFEINSLYKQKFNNNELEDLGDNDEGDNTIGDEEGEDDDDNNKTRFFFKRKIIFLFPLLVACGVSGK